MNICINSIETEEVLKDEVAQTNYSFEAIDRTNYKNESNKRFSEIEIRSFLKQCKAEIFGSSLGIYEVFTDLTKIAIGQEDKERRGLARQAISWIYYEQSDDKYGEVAYFLTNIIKDQTMNCGVREPQTPANCEKNKERFIALMTETMAGIAYTEKSRDTCFDICTLR